MKQDSDPHVTSWEAFDGAESDSTPAGPTIAVGPDTIVAAANAMIDLFDKQGRLLVPGPHITLDKWFEDVLAPLGTDFVILAPQVVYDPVDERYVVSAIANNLEEKLSLIVFSVSEDADPTGGWCDYFLGPSITGQDVLPLMAEHMTLAVNRDAIYFASSLYDVVDSGPGTTLGFDHSRAFFLAKSIYYQQATCAADSEQQWTRAALTDARGEEVEYVRAASNLDGTQEIYLAHTVPEGGEVINVWRGRTRADEAAPLAGNLERSGISVGAYDLPPDADQRGTAEPIATANARLTSAVFGDDRLWLAHTVACMPDDAQSCYKWYTIDTLTRNVEEDGFWGQTDGHYFVPAVMPDGNAEPVIVQNFSATGQFVGVSFDDGRGHPETGRDRLIRAGTACYDDNRGNPSSVWGFTSGIALDPVRGTVWGHAAYAKGGSTSDCARNDWQTVIFEIDWPNRPGEAPGPTPTSGPGPTPTPGPTADNWRIGVPIVANREFRGVYVGAGRYVERRGSISGRANSAVQIQNLDGNNALNATTYYVEQPDPYRGDPSVAPPQHRVDLRNVAAGGASNMYLPSLNLPSGLFSAAIESEGPTMTAAIARTDWSTGGAGIYSNVRLSDRLVVPLVVRNYYGLSSIVSIMADGPATTRARVDFFRSGDSTPLAGPRYTISPWAAVTFDVNDAISDFDRLGSGFLGAAVITVEGSGRVGAASLVYSELNPLAVSAFEGIPATDASDTLYVPLFRARQRGVGPGDLLDTGISVFNPQSTAANVTVSYYPTDSASASAACRSQRSYTHGPVRIAANSSYVFYQGPGGGHGLPDDCFGSAVVRTSSSADKVLAIVNDSTNGSQLTAAYNAISSTRADTKVAVPLFRNEHLAQRFTTGIQVMNVGSRQARVEISFTRVEGSNSVPITGCGDDCLAFVDPNRSYTWYPPAIRAIGANTYGSAIIKSDEPVVAIINDYPLAGGVDAAIYNGIAVIDQPGGGASSLLGRRPRD